MTGLLEGKNFLVTGAANSRSIAWSVALAIKREGGSVALTYQAERLKRRVGALAAKLSTKQINKWQCRTCRTTHSGWKQAPRA